MSVHMGASNLTYQKDYGQLDFPEDENLFTQNEFMAFINDYAFYLYESGEYQTAGELLTEVVSVCPDRAVAWLNLGDLYWDLGEKKTAVGYYEMYKELLEDDSKLPEQVILRLSGNT